MHTNHHSTPSATVATKSTLRATDLAAAALGAIATGVTIFVLGRATETFEQHLALVLAALSVTVLGIWFAPGDRGRTRIFAIGGIAATLLVAMALGGLLSRPTAVNEQVVTADVAASDVMEAKDPSDDAMMAKGDGTRMEAAGAKQNVLLASGSFTPLEHAGEGTASLIRTADGTNVLTLTGFSTDAGPDLDVRLVAGNPMNDADVEAGSSVRLGKLKGTSGDQQYVLPANVDPSEFTDVYIWCRAFSVGFTRATLT